jgi:hypothetical protein
MCSFVGFAAAATLITSSQSPATNRTRHRPTMGRRGRKRGRGGCIRRPETPATRPGLEPICRKRERVGLRLAAGRAAFGRPATSALFAGIIELLSGEPEERRLDHLGELRGLRHGRVRPADLKPPVGCVFF